MNEKPIFVGSRQVGVVHMGIFRRCIRKKNYLRRPVVGISTSTEALNQAAALGALWMQVMDTDTGICYGISLKYLREAGIPIDYGWGSQLAAPLAAFTISRKGGGLPSPSAKQPELFGGTVMP